MIDFDKVYEPEQLDQLAKDLVKGRKKKLDPLEKASLKRWKRDGVSARIRRMWDKPTCWPADMASRRTFKKPNPNAPVHSTNIDFPHYQVSVALRFDRQDLQLLRAAALTDKPRRGERSIFDKAADSIENRDSLVTQVMSADELKGIVGRFAQAGVSHVTVDTLRVGDAKPARV